MMSKTMYKLILFISSVFIIGCTYDDCHHHHHNTTDNSYCEIDNELLPYVEMFKKDCQKYGWDTAHINHLNSITVETDLDAWGVTYHDSKSIVIDEELLKDNIGIRHVMYHELGHWYGKDHHDHGCIMHDGYSLYGIGASSSVHWDDWVGHFFYNDW